MCQSAGAQEAVDVRATSLSTLVHMVAGHLGMTLLPEMALPYEVEANERLRAIPFSGDAPYRTIGLGWRSGSPRREAYQALADTIRSVR